MPYERGKLYRATTVTDPTGRVYSAVQKDESNLSTSHQIFFLHHRYPRGASAPTNQALVVAAMGRIGKLAYWPFSCQYRAVPMRA